jgi:hypothetical protein
MIIDNSFTWWTGVVEDRDDPEKLGRCRVRIFGYHTADTNLLPTSDLPWAIPLQSITSAATSGLGHTPVGIVPGTWVMGWFLDGEEAQRPLILGTIAGKPITSADAVKKLAQQEIEVGFFKASDGKVIRDENNNPIVVPTNTTSGITALPPLSVNDIEILFKAIAVSLSNNNISTESTTGNLGKYQISVSRLMELGYINRQREDSIPEEWANFAENWTGQNGIKTKAMFLANENEQEIAMFASIKEHYNTLIRLEKITETDNYRNVAGLLTVAHVMGVNNADKLNKKTETGVRAKDYFVLGNSALGGIETDFVKSLDSAGNYLPSVNDNSNVLNNDELRKLQGFQDPNKKYPKIEYANVSDINKLAVGDTSHLSLLIKENKRIDKISITGTPKTWDEPSSAYGAVYPYNQVIETEAGHVIELDSTPGAERIQVFHKSGTYIEVDVNGTMVRKTVGDNYEILDRNNFTYIKGAHNLTVEGQTNIFVKDDAKIEVDGDLSVVGHGKTSVATAGTASVVAENFIVSADKSITMVTNGDFNIQGKDINLYAKGGSMTQKASGDISMESGTTGTFSIKGGLALLLDAAIVKTKMGANRVREIAYAVLPRPSSKTPDNTEVPVLPREILAKSNYLFDSNEDNASTYQQLLEKSGLINSKMRTKISTTDSTSQNSSSTGNPELIVNSDLNEIRQFKYFPRSFILSKKENRIFTLGDMLQDGGLTAQRGLTEQQIVYNLKQLVVNCLDPIKAKYPDMKITSGFRSSTSQVFGSISEKSDHGLGAAADIKFTNTDKREYKAIAEWIVANVPHRQIILEYYFQPGSSKLKSAWIHVSFLTYDGSLVKSSYPNVQTFVNHQSKYTKLVNLA